MGSFIKYPNILNHALITLSAIHDEHSFLRLLTTAWNWIQLRPQFYPQTGGYQTLDEFIATARMEIRQNIAVFSRGEMISLFMIDLVGSDVVQIHVISPRKTDAKIVLAALRQLRDSVFEKLKVNRGLSGVGVYRSHVNKGVKRLLEDCGLEFTGDIEETPHGQCLHYELTRDRWKEIYEHE